VQPPGLQVAADPAGLDVDDPAGAEADRVDRQLGRGDRLVEADRGLQTPGELGMAEQVVLGQRLLDQQQPERVQLRQLRRATSEQPTEKDSGTSPRRSVAVHCRDC